MEPQIYFPHPLLTDEQGLLAIGGDLSIERLLLAYQFGIFPWYADDQPILWWSPNPRFVLFPEKVKVSKSMRSLLNKKRFRVTVNNSFSDVIRNCKEIKRSDQSGTWITEEVFISYQKLHQLGNAHSVEVWEEEKLVGGLYGVCLGNIFFGESMFSFQSNASKYGFILFVKYLQTLGCQLIDCQIESEHLTSLGAETMAREDFFSLLKRNIFNEDLKILQKEL